MPTPRRLTAVAVWLAALATPAAAAAQIAPGSRILVMPFAVQADASTPGGAGAAFWLGEAASILMTEELQNLGMGALSRDDRVAAADRLQIPLTPALTRATMIRAAELVGASDLVFGQVQLANDKLTVRVRLIQLETGRQLPDVALDAPLAEIFQLFERVARLVAQSTGRPVAVRPRQPHPSLETFENYVKGLVALTPAAQQRFLELAFRQAPRDARILLALWNTYTEEGLHEKALGAARNVPPDSPLARRARFCAALSLIDLSRYDEAFRDLSALNETAPAPALSNALGIVQLRRSVASTAGTPAYYFHRAVEGAPEDTNYLFNLGYAYAIAHDSQAALFWLREAVRFDATNGDAHLVMSAVLQASGKPTEAQRELDLAKQLGTRRDVSATALSDRVPAGLERLSTDLGGPGALRLEAVGSPAQREQQEVARFHLEQGRLLFDAQKDREAVNELRRAIYLSPYQDEPHLLLGRLYQRTGRQADAIEEFKVAVWCKETPEALVALAGALLDRGDAAGAKQQAQRALVLRPDDAAARDVLKRAGG